MIEPSKAEAMNEISKKLFEASERIAEALEAVDLEDIAISEEAKNELTTEKAFLERIAQRFQKAAKGEAKNEKKKGADA